jgi:hypothetical protein
VVREFFVDADCAVAKTAAVVSGRFFDLEMVSLNFDQDPCRMGDGDAGSDGIGRELHVSVVISVPHRVHFHKLRIG